MKTKDKILVTLASCDPSGTYSRHVAAVMASVYANTKDAVYVHLIHDDTLTPENREKLIKTAGRFGQEVAFLNAEKYVDASLLSVNEQEHPGARGTFSRLLIPRLLHLDKVIYLDCDILVHMDIAELWRIPAAWLCGCRRPGPIFERLCRTLEKRMDPFAGFIPRDVN